METKTNLNTETINTLQDLLRANIDSRDGLLDAVANTQNSVVAAAFRDLATRRNDQASELAAILSDNGETPQAQGTISAAAHRVWMDLRAAVGQGTKAMLEEAERGEDHIKTKYETALKETAGSAVTDILNHHYAHVKAAHDSIRDLRDACT